MGLEPQNGLERQRRIGRRPATRAAIGLSVGAAITLAIAFAPVAAEAVTTTPRLAAASQKSVAPPVSTPGPVRVCGNKKILTGPSTAPRNSVIVRKGDDSRINLDRANTTYYFLTGIHTLGDSGFSQIIPGDNSSYVGAPGAVISGQNLNSSAFSQHATNVTIEYLTIEAFVPNNDAGAVNHDSSRLWTIEHDTLKDIGNQGGAGSGHGSALMMGSRDTYSYDCLTGNGQYAIDGYAASHRGDFVDSVISHDEISWNGVSEFPDVNGCGCSGGFKLLFSTDMDLEDNYIHDNYNVGAWFDTDNTGALVEGNYFARNWASGLMYEASTNADITDNTFVDNSWGGSSQSEMGFPGAAIYISNSGGNPTDNHGIYSTFAISDNEFIDNWGGVVIFQNPNRYCGDGGRETGGSCPDVDQVVATPKACVDPRLITAPLFTDCQYATNNILVDGNDFNFDETHIVRNEGPNGKVLGPGTLPGRKISREIPARCANPAYDCGYNALFSSFGCAHIGCGGNGAVSPYARWVIPNRIMTTHATAGGVLGDNFFCGNTYEATGHAWKFQAFTQGGPLIYPNSHPHGIVIEGGLSVWRTVWHEDPAKCPAV
jgi:hypothetical protein